MGAQLSRPSRIQRYHLADVKTAPITVRLHLELVERILLVIPELSMISIHWFALDPGAEHLLIAGCFTPVGWMEERNETPAIP